MLFRALLHWLVPIASAAEEAHEFYLNKLWNIFDPTAANVCPPQVKFVGCLALRLANFVAQFVWIGCTLAIIWGGIRMASSGGNDEGRTQGKAIVVTAMIGFALALTAQVIINFAASTFSTL